MPPLLLEIHVFGERRGPLLRPNVPQNVRTTRRVHIAPLLESLLLTGSRTLPAILAPRPTEVIFVVRSGTNLDDLFGKVNLRQFDESTVLCAITLTLISLLQLIPPTLSAKKCARQRFFGSVRVSSVNP